MHLGSVRSGRQAARPKRGTAGVVSEGLKLFFDRRRPESSGAVSRPNGIAHGIPQRQRRAGADLDRPFSWGAGRRRSWKDALTRIVTLPPGGRRKRSGEAVSARPAPPVCGTATRSSSRRLDRLRIVSFWTERQFVRAAGPEGEGGWIGRQLGGRRSADVDGPGALSRHGAVLERPGKAGEDAAERPSIEVGRASASSAAAPATVAAAALETVDGSVGRSPVLGRRRFRRHQGDTRPDQVQAGRASRTRARATKTVPCRRRWRSGRRATRRATGPGAVRPRARRAPCGQRRPGRPRRERARSRLAQVRRPGSRCRRARPRQRPRARRSRQRDGVVARPHERRAAGDNAQAGLAEEEFSGGGARNPPGLAGN